MEQSLGIQSPFSSCRFAGGRACPFDVDCICLLAANIWVVLPFFCWSLSGSLYFSCVVNLYCFVPKHVVIVAKRRLVLFLVPFFQYPFSMETRFSVLWFWNSSVVLSSRISFLLRIGICFPSSCCLFFAYPTWFQIADFSFALAKTKPLAKMSLPERSVLLNNEGKLKKTEYRGVNCQSCFHICVFQFCFHSYRFANINKKMLQ